ncbi:MAG: hypothetical protein L6R37_003204 [Teloschistes peruensis]|nr:MAG: hypothetical protein L6R37_003204 [Teloschistes peruensis]
MAQHRAVLHTSPATPLSLQVHSLPTPTPGPGSTIVKILATPVLGYAKEVFSGERAYSMPLPLTQGTSAIGRVTAVGPDATTLQPGALVLCDIFLAARDSPSSHFLMGLHAGSPSTKRLMDGEWRHSTWAEYAKFPLENLYLLDEEVLLRRQGYSVRDLCTLTTALVGFGGLDEIGLRVGETVVIAPNTLRSLNDTFGATNPLSTVTMTGTLEGDTAALRAACATTKNGFSAYLDLPPPPLLPPNLGANLEIPCGLVVHKQLRFVGKWMYTREQVERCVRMAEMGAFGLGERAGVRTVAGFGLEEAERAVETAAVEAKGWGRQIVVEPWGAGATSR